jgi:hypothetical protein
MRADQPCRQDLRGEAPGQLRGRAHHQAAGELSEARPGDDERPRKERR